MQNYSLRQESRSKTLGIGEIIRRILGCNVMKTLRRNILECAGYLQLCTVQSAKCEAAVHALSSVFSEDDSNGILLVVDADNAFNQINQNVMLHNTEVVCPIIATDIINSYSQEARIFISRGEEIKSAEGTT